MVWFTYLRKSEFSLDIRIQQGKKKTHQQKTSMCLGSGIRVLWGAVVMEKPLLSELQKSSFENLNLSLALLIEQREQLLSSFC